MEQFTVQVDDRTYRRLKDEAERERISVEELAGALLSTIAHTSGPDTEKYRSMARRHMKRYESVFRRLAE